MKDLLVLVADKNMEYTLDAGLRRSGYTHALMVLDYEGSGGSRPAEELERHLDSVLEIAWGKNAKTIIIEPERPKEAFESVLSEARKPRSARHG